MQRREFIKASGTVLAASAIGSTSALALDSATAARTVLPLNRHWRFHASKLEGAHLPAFNDADFETVVLPHTNITLPWHNFDDRAYEFISTYRRRFKYPAAAAGKRVFVDFEGAMTASTVWINGEPLGEYKGGFTPFSFELTKHLHQDRENILVVEVDSTERPDIPPFGYEIDYLTFGGLYREVSLRIVAPTYIDNIFARPKDVLSANPSVDIDVFLAGDTVEGLNLEFELRYIVDQRVLVVAQTTAPVTLGTPGPDAALDPTTPAPVYASVETITDPARISLPLSGLDQIHLWDLDNPNLYTLHVNLLNHGKVIDSHSRRIGFREACIHRPAASRSTARSSSSAASTATRPSPSSARPCLPACSAKTPTSSARACTATSSAPRTIPNPATF